MAAQKGTAEKLGDELLVCSICLEPFNKPKVLPCLHSFCLECLQRHYDVYKLKNGGRLSCPSCREVISVPAEGVSCLRDDVAVARTQALLSELTEGHDGVLDEEPACAGAEGGFNDTGQLRQEIQSTVKNLHNTLTKLRSKLLQVYQVENHVQYALETESAEGAAGAKPSSGKRSKQDIKKQTKKIESHQQSLAQLAVEEDRLHHSFVELKSTHDVLELLLHKGSSTFLQHSAQKLQRLMNDVLPFLESESPVHDAEGASGGLDMSTLAVTYSPTHTSKKPTKRTSSGPLQPPGKKGQKLPCTLLFKIGCRGMKSGKFNFPVHATFAPDGTIIVCDKNNMRLQQFSQQGEFIRKMLCNEVKPRRARISPADGLLYISDEVAECVKVYTQDGQLVRRICEAEFQCPAGIDINSQGHIIMTDAEKCFVSVHKPDGEKITKFYHRYLTDKLIPNPYYAVTNEDDELIISDFRNNTIKVFSSTGKLLFVISKLRCPRGICVDPFGNILVAEGDAHRVSMYDPYGKFMRHVLTAQDGLQYPLSLDMNLQGQLLVTQCGYYSPHEVMLFQVY